MLLTNSTYLKNLRLNSYLSALTSGKIEIYTDPIPEAGEAITTQTLLTTINLHDPSGIIYNGVFTLNVMPVLDSIAINTGIPTWARFYTSDDTWLFDADVGEDNIDPLLKPFLIVSPVNIYTGGTLRLTEMILTEP